MGPRAGLDRGGKSRPPPEFDPRTVQAVARKRKGPCLISTPTHAYCTDQSRSLGLHHGRKFIGRNRRRWNLRITDSYVSCVYGKEGFKILKGTVCYSLLQSVTVRYSLLQSVTVSYSPLQSVTVRYSLLQSGL